MNAYRSDDAATTRIRLIRDAADSLARVDGLRNVGLAARTEMAREVVDGLLSVETERTDR